MNVKKDEKWKKKKKELENQIGNVSKDWVCVCAEMYEMQQK